MRFILKSYPTRVIIIMCLRLELIHYYKWNAHQDLDIHNNSVLKAHYELTFLWGQRQLLHYTQSCRIRIRNSQWTEWRINRSGTNIHGEVRVLLNKQLQHGSGRFDSGSSLHFQFGDQVKTFKSTQSVELLEQNVSKTDSLNTYSHVLSTFHTRSFSIGVINASLEFFWYN